MQANCSQCGQRIAIDDARVPDRPFIVKCPKCQAQVKLPGKGQAAPTDPAATMPPPAPPAPAVPSDEARAQMMAQVRRELTAADPTAAGRGMVVLPDQSQASAAMTLALSRLGFQVETIDDLTEAFHFLEQGVFTIVAASRAAPPQVKGGETFYQRLNRMSPEARRRVFVCLVGTELKTGDATQAFALQADLVLAPKDLAGADGLIRATLGERNRLYRAFLDVLERREHAPV